MNSILGPAAILDFDGTLARLPVSWPELLARIGVNRLGDLPRSEGHGRKWGMVSTAETEAAARAEPVGEVMRALELVRGFAVLSGNSEQAVWRFLERFPQHCKRCRLVVGRDGLGGPKTDPDRFRRGFHACLEAIRDDRDDSPVVYVGDSSYELELARSLSAVAVDVREVTGSGGIPGSGRHA